MRPSPTTIDRRTALKGIGGLATLGIGGYALTGGGAAMNTSFTANPVTVSSDTGDVDEVHLAPVSTVSWENFDVPVTKVRQLLEARIEDDDGNPLTVQHSATPGTQDYWWPIWRETPWLFTTDDTHPDATGSPDFDYRGDDAWFVQPSYATDFAIDGGSGQKEKGTSGQIEYPLVPSAAVGRDPSSDPNIYVVSEAAPMPDYPNEVGNIGESMETLLSGISIAGGGNFYNGSYGTVAGAFGEDGSKLFDNPTDGTDLVRTVRLRLTTTLHTDYDFAENVDSSLDDRLTPLAMGASGDVGHQFTDTNAIPYADLRANAGSHPAIDVVEAAFAVTATNEPAETKSQTSGNTGGS